MLPVGGAPGSSPAARRWPDRRSASWSTGQPRTCLTAGASSPAAKRVRAAVPGSTRQVHRAVPLLRRIGQALGEQLLQLGMRAAPQQQGHAPVALGPSAAGIGAAGWPRGGPAPASPGNGWFDTGRERDSECVSAGAPIRRLLAGSRLGTRALGNSSARTWPRPPLPGDDHELTEPGQVNLGPALPEAQPRRHVPIPAARHTVKRPPACVALPPPNPGGSLLAPGGHREVRGVVGLVFAQPGHRAVISRPPPPSGARSAG
jgi:hypothetical protein